jgi:hypothetical protein
MPLRVRAFVSPLHDAFDLGQVYKECAYASEKSERRLVKLEERFLDPVQVTRTRTKNQEP